MTEPNKQERELTPKELDVVNKEMHDKMGVDRKALTRQELEAEIISYLDKKQALSLGTVGADGAPRISVVDYVNDGLTIYVYTEGGRKLDNLRHDKRVAAGLGSSARTFRSVRGVNITGIADVFSDDDPEYAEAMKLFQPIFEAMEKELGIKIEFPKGMRRIIRITPQTMVYYHNNKGISNAHWEAD
jgi:nitroimidazol reductase NimA-like FMN-containing flavoprotein (pyridoxamine 5'-phosphate oxidase superfamily)